MTDEPLRMHILRGILVAIVAGPIMLIAGAVAAVTIVSAVFGWEPGFLAKKTAFDFLYGGGSFSLVKFFAFAVSGTIAGVAWFAIDWAFTGRSSGN